MVGVIVVTHGQFGKYLLEAAQTILECGRRRRRLISRVITGTCSTLAPRRARRTVRNAFTKVICY